MLKSLSSRGTKRSKLPTPRTVGCSEQYLIHNFDIQFLEGVEVWSEKH